MSNRNDEIEERTSQATTELQAEIKEHLQTVHSLRENEECYRVLVENAPVGIFRSTPGREGRFLTTNPAFRKIFGIGSEEEAQNLGIADLHYDPKERRTVSDRLVESGNVTGIELRLRKVDDTPLWCSVSINTITDETGETVYLDGIVEDIDRRKQAEKSLKRRLEEMEMLHKVSFALRDTKTRSEMLTLLLDETLSALNAEDGSILVYDASPGDLRIAVARGWMTQLKAPVGISPITFGAAFDIGKPYISREFATDSQLKTPGGVQLPKDWGGACFPILIADDVMGIVVISVPLPREISMEELGLLPSLAEMAGSALQRIDLYEETLRRLEQVQALRSIDMAISGTLDLRVIFRIILDEVTRLLNVDAAAILRLDLYTGMLKYEAWRGFRVTPAKLNLCIGDGLAGQAVVERKTIRVVSPSEIENDPIQGSLMAKEGAHTYYAVPLIVKSKVEGVLEIFNREPLDASEEWLDFLETLAGQAAVAIDNAKLVHSMARANFELIRAYDTTIEGWARTLEMKDAETEGHSQRVTEMTVNIARKMGMSEEELAHVRRGALLHDIGKIGIPDAILFKLGKLTDEDWVTIRRHPTCAFEVLSPIEYLRPALDIPYCHHEKWDGTGYPRGLKREEIPLAARIFAVVDVYDALTSDRPYRKAWTREEALEYISQESGRHFDPRVVEMFLEEMKISGLL